MANTAEKVYELIKSTVEECGVSLWDVRFLKEGASYYLRVFIDKPDGICIDDCTEVSHKIDPIIDAADPIDVSYYLEVCSSGIERELTREEHYKAFIGRRVKLKLYKAYEKSKEIEGTLKDYSGGPVITLDDGREISFLKSEVSKAISQTE